MSAEGHGATRALVAALEQAADRIEALERAEREPVAIVGVSCRFPGDARDPASLWRLLRGGTDAVTEVPADRWDLSAYYDADPDVAGTMYARHAGFIDGVDLFDPQFFEIAPKEALALDPQQRLLLELTWQAFEDANLPRERVAGTPTGVFVGITNHDYERVLNRVGGAARADAYFSSGNTLNAAAGRIAYVFGLQGPALAIDTACSSSLVAVHLACQSLRRGECTMAVAAGVNLILSPEGHVALSRMRALAPDGRCKTFDAAADGYVRGEGGGVVILKRLSDALAAGDVPLAVIRGSAVNQDGASGGFTVPSGPAQRALIRQALADAQLTPADIAYVEAHGTGTALGDPIELGALAAIFGEGRPHDRPLLVGSLKTNVGHLESAAGVAGLIKVVLALRHDEIPPHLHFHHPTPHVSWRELPLRVVTAPTAWPQTPRRAGVSAFGASGTNAHVIVEEAPPAPSGDPAGRRLHAIVLSAKTEEALDAHVRGTCDFLAATDADLADVAYAAGAGRTHFRHRVAVVAGSAAGAADALRAFVEGDAGKVKRGQCPGAAAPRLAFLFTGHGSQSAGMAAELCKSSTVFRRVIEECDEELAGLGIPLVRSLLGDDEGWLGRNDVSHPALFAVEVALADLYRSWGITPDAVLGYSLGEYAAACVAGVFSVRDGVRLVAGRAALIEQLAGDGAMAAVFAEEARVRAALPASGQTVVAARNGPRHTVISGPRDEVAPAVARLERDGAECLQLAVSHAFHSPLMEPMLEPFRQLVASIALQAPRVPLISNVTGEQADAAIATPGYWCDHARKPVRFSKGLDALLGAGYGAFLEIGPHPVLTGPAREAAGDAGDGKALWVPSLDRRMSNWQSLLDSAAALHVNGVAVDWARVDGRSARGRVRLPSYPFQRRRYWVGDQETRQQVRGSAVDGTSLLGARLSLPGTGEVRFESVLRAGTHEFLQDHQVQGHVVFAAASYVAMALEAAIQVLGRDEVALEDVAFERPLVLPLDADVTLQTVVALPNVSIYSRSGDEWLLHATGRIAAETPGRPAAVPPDAARLEAVSGDAYYAECARRGIEFGPAFRGLDTLWRTGHDEAESRVRLPDDVPPRAFPIHPVLLDAAFQTLGPAAGARDGDAAFLPFSIGRLRFHRRPGTGSLTSRARLAPAAESREPGARSPELSAAILLWDAEGVVLEVDDFTLRRAEMRPPIHDPLFVVAWKDRPLDAASSASADVQGPCVILADRGGVARELSRLLEARGVAATVVAPGAADALRGALEGPSAARHVVGLGSLDVGDLTTASSPTLDAALRALNEGTLALVRQVAAAPRPPRLWLVTRGAQPADERMSAAGCVQASLWGLVRTALMEHDELRPVRIDLDTGDGRIAAGDAKRICDEIVAGGPDDEVALRWQKRLAPRLVRLPAGGHVAADAAVRVVRADRSYLVTGGLGGLGLVTAEWLVGQGVRHLVLVSRGSPDHSVADRLEAWRRSGADVVAYPCDVADADQLAGALARARRMAPLGGIVHSAGTLADATLAQQDWEKFRRVFAAKVYGAWNLHRLTARDTLDFFVLYASTAGVLGSPGQGNHAAANAFVDALAWHRRSRRLPALAIDWGAWSTVGEAARHHVGDRARERGVGTIDPATGMRVLERLLRQPATQVVVAPIDWGTFAAQFPDGCVPGLMTDLAGVSARGRSPAVDVRARVAAALPDRRRDVLVEYVLEQLAHALETTVDQVDAQQPFNTLGFDSLMAVDLRRRFKQDLEVDVPVKSLLVGPTADLVASELHAGLERGAPAAAGSAAAPALDNLSAAETLARVGELSDAQVEELLATLERDGEPT